MKKFIYRLFNDFKIQAYIMVLVSIVDLLRDKRLVSVETLIGLSEEQRELINGFVSSVSLALEKIDTPAEREAHLISLTAELFYDLTKGKFGTKVECREYFVARYRQIKSTR